MKRLQLASGDGKVLGAGKRSVTQHVQDEGGFSAARREKAFLLTAEEEIQAAAVLRLVDDRDVRSPEFVNIPPVLISTFALF
jgi:hypothetical protein